jgi:hypothetical protein
VGILFQETPFGDLETRGQRTLFGIIRYHSGNRRSVVLSVIVTLASGKQACPQRQEVAAHLAGSVTSFHDGYTGSFAQHSLCISGTALAFDSSFVVIWLVYRATDPPVNEDLACLWHRRNAQSPQNGSILLGWQKGIGRFANKSANKSHDALSSGGLASSCRIETLLWVPWLTAEHARVHQPNR